MTDGGRREYVQSLERGLAVIQAFGPERPEMTLSEVAEVTGMNRAAARRFLLTLQALGHVGTDGRRFFLRPQVLNLGYSYLSSVTWLEVVQSAMEELARQVRESCSASVLDGEEIVYVARVPASRLMTITLSIGSRLPATTTSMGRVLLAALPDAELDAFLDRVRIEPQTERTITDKARLRTVLDRVRAEGYCLVDQELEVGLRSLAVPILDRSGRAIAALNTSTHAGRMRKADMLTEFLPHLREAQRQIRLSLPR